MPEELKYSRDHEWVYLEGDNAVVGISVYAQESLGDLVFIELPETGKEVARGDEVAVVESVKIASEIYAPVSGTIVAVNEALSDNIDLLTSGIESGWIVKIKCSDPSQLSSLMDEEGYSKYLETDHE